MTSTFAPPAVPRARTARGPAAPILWPLPACIQPGELEVRWDAPPDSREGTDRRYQVRLKDLRTQTVIVCDEVHDTSWFTPELPAGGLYEVCVRVRETLSDGAASTSAGAERRFRTGYRRG